MPFDRYFFDNIWENCQTFICFTNIFIYLDSSVVGGAGDEKSKDTEHPPEFERGHSRNSSCTSQHSKASGYGSLAHSRQSSAESGHQR